MTGFVSKRQAAQGKLNDDTQVYAGRKRGSIALARELCVQIAGYTDDDQDQCGHDYGSVDIAEILSAEVLRLQKALAQPEQEPVAWVCYGAPGKRDIDFEEADINGLPIGTSLYITPPQQQAEPPPPEWPLIKNILAVFGLDAIAFVAAWKAAQQQAEPVLQRKPLTNEQINMENFVGSGKPVVFNDLTTPPQREWVGLTDWEREAIAHACGAMGSEWLVFIEAVEKALKEKNR